MVSKNSGYGLSHRPFAPPIPGWYPTPNRRSNQAAQSARPEGISQAVFLKIENEND